MTPLWVVALTSGVVAAGVSALFQLINGWRERVAADKRHLRDLALKAAVVQWEHQLRETEKHNRNIQFGEEEIRLTEVNFDMILVRKLKMIETFGKPNLTEQDVRLGVKEMNRIATAIREEFPRA